MTAQGGIQAHVQDPMSHWCHMTCLTIGVWVAVEEKYRTGSLWPLSDFPMKVRALTTQGWVRNARLCWKIHVVSWFQFKDMTENYLWRWTDNMMNPAGCLKLSCSNMQGLIIMCTQWHSSRKTKVTQCKQTPTNFCFEKLLQSVWCVLDKQTQPLLWNREGKKKTKTPFLHDVERKLSEMSQPIMWL